MEKVHDIVTQNVDGLHIAAGNCSSPSAAGLDLVELHGSIHEVKCMGCGDITSRASLQHKLHDANAHVFSNVEGVTASDRPDGDIDVGKNFESDFTVLPCEKCEGILKPNVVFFGDNLDKAVAQRADTLVKKCDKLLVLGTSLPVLSSFRLAREAAKINNKPTLIVNIGPTRADEFITDPPTTKTEKLEANVTKILPLVLKALEHGLQ
jgi:NAD-dependent SIR2 family protein deacetylase